MADRNPSRAPASDVPTDLYNLIRQQTEKPAGANSAGLLGVAAFIVAAVLIVVALETGADFQEILLGAFAVAAVNVVLAVAWMATRSEK